MQHSRPRSRRACQPGAHASPRRLAPSPAAPPPRRTGAGPAAPPPPGLHEGFPVRPAARTIDPVPDSSWHPARSRSRSAPATQPLQPHRACRSRLNTPALRLPGACTTLPPPVPSDPSRLSIRRPRQPPASRPRRSRRTAPAWPARGTPGPTRGAHYGPGTRLQPAPSTVQKALGPCNSPSPPVPPHHTGRDTPRRLCSTPVPGPVTPVTVNPPLTPSPRRLAPSPAAPPPRRSRTRLACTRDSRPDPWRALWIRYPTHAGTQHGPEAARSLQPSLCRLTAPAAIPSHRLWRTTPAVPHAGPSCTRQSVAPRRPSGCLPRLVPVRCPVPSGPLTPRPSPSLLPPLPSAGLARPSRTYRPVAPADPAFHRLDPLHLPARRPCRPCLPPAGPRCTCRSVTPAAPAFRPLVPATPAGPPPLRPSGCLPRPIPVRCPVPSRKALARRRPPPTRLRGSASPPAPSPPHPGPPRSPRPTCCGPSPARRGPSLRPVSVPPSLPPVRPRPSLARLGPSPRPRTPLPSIGSTAADYQFQFSTPLSLALMAPRALQVHGPPDPRVPARLQVTH